MTPPTTKPKRKYVKSGKFTKKAKLRKKINKLFKQFKKKSVGLNEMEKKAKFTLFKEIYSSSH